MMMSRTGISTVTAPSWTAEIRRSPETRIRDPWIQSGLNRNNSAFRPEVSVPGKARSKRSRAVPGNWALASWLCLRPPRSHRPRQSIMKWHLARQEDGESGAEEERRRRKFKCQKRRRRAKVPSLCHRRLHSGGPDPWARNSLQRLWSPVQVGSASARVPARCEPDLHADEAFELAPEGDGAPEAKGVPKDPPSVSKVLSEDMNFDGSNVTIT
ncbi:GATA transcription factor 12 [Actinidia rufa]|uniref:GATA transcription factor 12 n=1 Tax=Actinidia rufa TaxID=165716 RepID=A0A7J0DXM5_9ERIC|nr:GATA transcription factor 12 [Actinidia rufa]